MNDYIRRADIERFIQNGLNNPDKSKAFGHDAVEILTEVHFMEAADVRPVVRGHWINYDSDSERYDDIGCPNCHKRFTVDAERFCDIGFVESDLKFCPNCGADMRPIGKQLNDASVGDDLFPELTAEEKAAKLGDLMGIKVRVDE